MNSWLTPPFIYFLILGFGMLLVSLCYFSHISIKKITSYVASLTIFALLIYTGIVIAHWIASAFWACVFRTRCTVQTLKYNICPPGYTFFHFERAMYTRWKAYILYGWEPPLWPRQKMQKSRPQSTGGSPAFSMFVYLSFAFFILRIIFDLHTIA